MARRHMSAAEAAFYQEDWCVSAPQRPLCGVPSSAELGIRAAGLRLSSCRLRPGAAEVLQYKQTRSLRKGAARA